jgi:hypothetical protein
MAADETLAPFAAIIDELLRGRRHSRATIKEKTGKSLAAADRWLKLISTFPGAEKRKEGRTTWVTLRPTVQKPTRPASIGACIATSLATLFEGTENERNFKDARDYMLRVRGDHYADLDRKFVFAPRGGEYVLPENAAYLDEVIDAILKTKLLRFNYTHNDGRTESLKLAPLSLLVFDHQLYVLCQRHDGSWYCYRFARMANVDATAQSFQYPSQNAYDPKRVLEPGFGVHISGTGPVEDVQLLIEGPWATFALNHRWHRSQDVTRNEDGSVLLRLRVRHCREVETWILGFGEFARVLSPVSLRDVIAARVSKMQAAYAQPRRTGPSISKAPKKPRGAGIKKTTSPTKADVEPRAKRSRG